MGSRMRLPVDALKNEEYMPFPLKRNFELLVYQHRWFSGRMLASHAGGPGSIPGRYMFTFLSKPHHDIK